MLVPALACMRRALQRASEPAAELAHRVLPAGMIGARFVALSVSG
jgi:hypothetical protein